MKEKRVLVGSCVNSFDDDGYCIQHGVTYADASEFAVGDERADEISEEEFRAAVQIPPDLYQQVTSHEVCYLLDREESQYMLYDYDDDIHYFFGK